MRENTNQKNSVFEHFSHSDAPLYRRAFDYSHTYWDDHIKDILWGMIYLIWIPLLLLLTFVSGFNLEFMHISMFKSQKCHVKSHSYSRFSPICFAANACWNHFFYLSQQSCSVLTKHCIKNAVLKEWRKLRIWSHFLKKWKIYGKLHFLCSDGLIQTSQYSIQ